MALLAAPGQSVQETSTAVGFDSLSSFTRAFAQFSGETPSTYRKRVAGEGFEVARLPRGVAAVWKQSFAQHEFTDSCHRSSWAGAVKGSGRCRSM